MLNLSEASFAQKDEDFSILKRMGYEANKAGSAGLLLHSTLSPATLSNAVSLLGTKLCDTRTRLTTLGGRRGPVRDVVKEEPQMYFFVDFSDVVHLSPDG